MSPSPPSSLLSDLKALPRAAWILFFGTFLNKFGGFVVPFLTLYFARSGFTLGQAGIAVSAYGAGNLLASFIGGHLTDHFGRRRTIILSMFSGAAAMLLLSQARSYPVILLMAALTGLTGELYRPASSALLTDLVPAGQRVTAFSAFRLSYNAGWAFGPATAGLIVAHGYGWLFLGDAITSVLFGLVVLFALPDTHYDPATAAGWGEAASVIRADAPFRRMLLGSLLIGPVFFQPISSFGLHVTHLGFSPAVFGALMSLNGAMVVLFELPLTTITRLFQPYRMVATGYALCGLGLALIAFSSSLQALTACMALFTVGEMVAMPMAAAAIADSAPANLRGRYMGAYGLTWSFSLLIGPAIGLKVWALSPPLLWVGCGVVALIAAASVQSIVPVAAKVRLGLAGPG